MIVLLAFWSLIVTGWLVGRICSVAGSVVTDDDWSQLALFTVFSKEVEWEQVKAKIGGIHRLTIGNGIEEPSVPNVYIFLHCSQLEQQRRLEVSAWKGVKVACLQKASRTNLMKRLLLKHQLVVWFDYKFVFDPEALRIKRAEFLGDSTEIKAAFQAGKQRILDLMRLLRSHGHVKHGSILEGKRRQSKRKLVEIENVFGLVPAESATASLACHVVLKKNSVLEGASLAYPFSMKMEKTKKRLVAIGVPTTSKGMQHGEVPVFVHALFSSMLKTVFPSELNDFKIVVFVGFDRGDPYFDNLEVLKKLYSQLKASQFEIVFLRLLPLQRVAMTWNMIFAFARQMASFDFFYQVNDDLNLITSGWLSAFTSILDEKQGFGVVGPSDNFNGFACSLLTQAMVTERHFRLFSGLLYPLPFRDWKSDRWLSFVYGSAHTHCSLRIKANNGAKGTRYTACPFESWRVILDMSKKQLPG